MKTILVTGGNGFIASYVIDILKYRGYKVITNVRNNNWKTDPDYERILKDCDVYNIDVRDQAGMAKLVEMSDGVIHLASVLGTKHVENAKNFYEINLFGTINILEACREFDVPIVYISVGNYFEHNNYSNSKVAAEREVLKYTKFCGVKGNIVRALNAIGGRQKVKNTGKILPTFITKALKNEPIEVYGGKNNCSVMDMIYVGDVARILCDVLTNLDDYFFVNDGSAIDTDKKFLAKRYGNTIEAGTCIGYPVYEIAEKVIKACNSKSEIIQVPMRPGETERSVVVANENNAFPLNGNFMNLDNIIQEAIEYYGRD
jgi:UDP-glucose 4-epimerase